MTEPVTTATLTLPVLQEELAIWAHHNFKGKPAWQPFVGCVEEAAELLPFLGVIHRLGRLGHAYLKTEQGIRGDAAAHDAKARDAVGDLLIFLADFCNKRGWDMQTILEATWTDVRRRDWIKYSLTGLPPEPADD